MVPGFLDQIKTCLQSVFVSHSLWQRINRPVYHPITKHFLRQLKVSHSGPPVIPVALLSALLLFLAVARVYGSVGAGVIWLMPLWLMCHSLICSARWIYRIVSLISRQGRDGVLDEVSVIPPGRVFIYLAICKVVLHEEDALAWTTMLRKLAGGIVFFAFAMTLFVTLIALEDIDTSRLSLMLVELSLLSIVIIHEHKQSVLLLSLLPMALSRRLKGQIDGTCLALACFAALQVLSFMFAIAGPAAIQALAWLYQLPVDIAAIGLAMTLALFLLIREILIGCLWRTVLHQTNAESSVLRHSTHVGKPIRAKALGGRVY